MSNKDRIEALYVKFDKHINLEEYEPAQSVICLINDLKFQEIFDKENNIEEGA